MQSSVLRGSNSSDEACSLQVEQPPSTTLSFDVKNAELWNEVAQLQDGQQLGNYCQTGRGG